MIPTAIDAATARRRADLGKPGFDTTAELEVLPSTIGQPRAVEALKLGVGIDHDGYNIFVLGPPASGRHSMVEHFLRQVAQEKATPSDWCHVYNFEDSRKPRLLELPAGVGCRLRRDMEDFVEDLSTTLSTVLEGDEYRTRRQVIDEEIKSRSEKIFSDLETDAKERGLAVLRTPMGVAFAPLKGDEVAPPEEFRKLPEEERLRLQQEVSELQEKLQQGLNEAPRWERERQERTRELNREVVGQAIAPMIEDLKARHQELPGVLELLDVVKKDVVEKLREILVAAPDGMLQVAEAAVRRYHVNLLVDHSDQVGAPVVYDDNPSFANLIGRIEHAARAGVLTTDFTLIKGGSLHRANGGYLILDARKLLSQPYAYDGLKRALQAGQLRIESPGEALGFATTISLEPEAVPLSAKVVLIGDAMLYYGLAQHDPDFGDLFKVAADFDPELPRDAEREMLYARLVATLVRDRELRPFDRSAVERVIEESARMTDDAYKLSARVRELGDLLREADYFAGEDGASEVVSAEHVDQTVAARTFRLDRMRERSQEMILRGTVLIATEGERVGEVNGLSVLQMGKFSFGRATRISARVRLGKGQVLDIEREVELSGPIHSKGVLILTGFLGARYARDQPLSMTASLVFEQSYGGVDGDSASSTELYALLSALSEVPLRQSLAVTGSVNQHGFVQAVGGLNHKIEGFFDLCRARELSGDQGVLIPASNVQHLMLRPDVVEAIEAGTFRVYPVETIDQGIELLTGVPAGELDESGEYPAESINGLVKLRMEELAEKSRVASRSGNETP